jgi:hypothetical protein
MCKNKQGEIVGLEVWATYFKELLNPKTNMITSEETIYFGPVSNGTYSTRNLWSHKKLEE